MKCWISIQIEFESYLNICIQSSSWHGLVHLRNFLSQSNGILQSKLNYNKCICIYTECVTNYISDLTALILLHFLHVCISFLLWLTIIKQLLFNSEYPYNVTQWPWLYLPHLVVEKCMFLPLYLVYSMWFWIGIYMWKELNCTFQANQGSIS